MVRQEDEMVRQEELSATFRHHQRWLALAGVALASWLAGCYLANPDPFRAGCFGRNAGAKDLTLGFKGLESGAVLAVQGDTLEISHLPFYRCGTLSLEEKSQLLQLVGSLVSQDPVAVLEPSGAARWAPGSSELVWWSLEGRDGLLSSSNLPVKTEDTLREIACLAFAKLPWIARRGIPSATPHLAENLGFPDSCSTAARRP
jgi:hypothetical protein